MPFLDYFVIALFSLMIVIVGLAFSRQSKNMSSFFAAGGALPWWLSGLSLFMSFFSAGTFVVWGSIAYEHGWVAITIQWMMGLGGFFIAYFIAPKWREAGVLTVGEYLGNRFGPSLQKFYSYIFLALSFLTTGAFLYPVAKLFNVSTGFSIEISVIALGLLIILYTAAGGLWAVVVTDVLQFVILFAAVLMVIPLAFDKVGGWNSFVSGSPEGFFDLISGEYTFGFLVAFALYNTIFIGGNWAYVQRYTSVASPNDAKKVGLLFGSLYLISPVLWMIPPMIYRVVGGELAGLENEGAYLLICKEVLPKGMLGLMLGGMIFATASSVNTALNMSSAVFTNDIFKRWATKATNRQLMRIARVSTIIFGLITIGVALLVPLAGGIVEVVLSVGAITGAPLYAPPIWALFSKKLTTQAVLMTSLISLGINLCFKFLTPALFDFSLNRAEEMLLGVFSPLILLILFEWDLIPLRGSNTALSTPKPIQHDPHEDTAAPQNRFAIRILGYALIFTGLLIGGLGFYAATGRLLVIGIGTIVLAIGGLFVSRN